MFSLHIKARCEGGWGLFLCIRVGWCWDWVV